MRITLLSSPSPGYTWEGMTKISFQEAVNRFKNNQDVFLLYDDGTEGLAEDIETIETHNNYGCEFGYDN